MPLYLLKTEPSTYSFADLERERTTVWNGVSNPAALQYLRAMSKGADVLIYHTGGEKAIVGLARVTKSAYADPARPELNAAGAPKFAVVELAARKAVPRPVTLAVLKADRRFADFALIRQSRLSVMPVPEELAPVLLGLCGLE